MAWRQKNIVKKHSLLVRVLSKLLPFNLIPAFNPKKRAKDRAEYIKEYENRSEFDNIAESIYFGQLNEFNFMNEFEIKMSERVEEYEKRAEGFLTFLVSGGLIFIATIFQGYNQKLGDLLLWGASLLIFSALLISIIKIIQINLAYFKLGEWQKNRLNFIRGEINLAELHWRTVRTHKMSEWFAFLAIFTLMSAFSGLFLIFAYFYIDAMNVDAGSTAGVVVDWL